MAARRRLVFAPQEDSGSDSDESIDLDMELDTRIAQSNPIPGRILWYAPHWRDALPPIPPFSKDPVQQEINQWRLMEESLKNQVPLTPEQAQALYESELQGVEGYDPGRIWATTLPPNIALPSLDSEWTMVAQNRR